MENALKGNVALITGSASGIGAAAARSFAQRGVLLALLDRDEGRMRMVANDIVQISGHEPLVIPANVEKAGEVTHAVKQTSDQFGRLDILVNSAGISSHIPFLELGEDAWDNIINIHLKGTFLCCRTVAPIMVNQRSGTIVNISSDYAAMGGANLAHYSAAKAGVLALTKSIALALAQYSIRVNAIAPGAVNTPMFRSHSTDVQRRKLAAHTPLGCIAQPGDIAAAICFLVSPDSSHISQARHFTLMAERLCLKPWSA